MNELVGQLKEINSIEGFLTSIEANLIGTISALNDVLVGTLTSTILPPLTGTLVSVKEEVLSGKMTIPPEVPVPNYQEEYIVTPKPFNDEILQTNGFKMTDDVTVLKIPYYQTSNEAGYTVYIGGE